MGQNSAKQLSTKEMKTYLSDANIKFNERDIRQLFETYRKNCQNRRHLTLSDFKCLYQEVFPGDSNLFAKHIFRAFDKDKNGSIDFREFLTGFSILAELDLDKKLDWIFDVYDINGDGEISLKEMEEILKAVGEMCAVAVGQDDALRYPETMARKLFDQLDTNGDGVISREEFCTGAKQDSSICRLLMNVNR